MYVLQSFCGNPVIQLRTARLFALVPHWTGASIFSFHFTCTLKVSVQKEFCQCVSQQERKTILLLLPQSNANFLAWHQSWCYKIPITRSFPLVCILNICQCQFVSRFLSQTLEQITGSKLLFYEDTQNLKTRLYLCLFSPEWERSRMWRPLAF